MTYHQQSWAGRVGSLGDQAEFVFETVWPDRWVRYGLNRPPISLNGVPAMLRNTPDYLTTNALVEVGGFGTDQVFKWKDSKHLSLQLWDEIHPTKVFIFDSKNKRYGVCPVSDLTSVMRKRAVKSEAFHDGPTYKAIPAELLPVEWTDLS